VVGAASPRHRFTREARLRKRRDFVDVQATGAKVHTKYFLVLVRKEGAGRVGITVTKRTGNAVTRNRLKRLIREFVRQARGADGDWVPPGRDVVIIAKNAAATRTRSELVADLARHRERVARC
jgi:ribonuclease P protein component